MALLWTVIFTACCVSAIGLDALAGGKVVNVLNDFFGNIGITKALGLNEMFFDLVIGNRISSTFQYPNTLASYLMAVFFVLVGLVTANKSLWVKTVGGCAGFITFATFMLTSSRGAYVMFPFVWMILLITLPKGSKLKAVFYSLIYVAMGGTLSFRLLSTVSDAENAYRNFWLTVAAGAIICALLTVIMTYVVKLLEKLNWKVYAISISALAILAAIALAYAFSITQPVILSNKDSENDSWKTVYRSAVLKPGKEYKLVFEVEASMKEEKSYAYSVSIDSRSKKEILFDKSTRLASLTGQATQGVETEEISFVVPEDSEIVRFTFSNYFQGTEATFYNVKIQDPASEKMVKNLALNYKYIPNALVTRLDDIRATKSGVQRLVYYSDGLKIMKDRPLLGAGGGAWSLLYFMYQSYSYISSQAHNYFLQLGVETGIVGLLVLLVLLLIFVFMYVFERKRSDESSESGGDGVKVIQSAVFTAICSLFMHSFIDFDFSLASVFILVWMLLGLYNSRYKAMKLDGLKKPSGYEHKLTAWIQYLLSRVKKIGFSPVLGIILTIAVGTFSVLFLTAKGYANDSQTASYYDTEEALQKMKIASVLNPFNIDYKIGYANLIVEKSDLSQQEFDKAFELIIEAEKDSRYNADSLTKIGAFYLSVGYIDKGLEVINSASWLKPLLPESWETVINAYSSVIDYFVNNNDLGNAYKYIDSISTVLEEAKLANTYSLNPFVLEDPSVMEKIEEFKFIRENLDYKKDESIDGEGISLVRDTLVFLNYPDMDLNSDGVPDQWTIQDPASTKISVDNENMVVDNTITGYGRIVSRKLNLEAGKNYTVEVKVANGETIEKIDYSLSGVSNASGVMVKSMNTFTADISVPSDFTSGSNKLVLGIPGKAVITDIKIYVK